MVVTSADEKEFKGKNGVKAKTTSSKTSNPVQTNTPAQQKSKLTESIKPIKPQIEEDDEWASF